MKHLVYTSVQRKEGSLFEISMMAQADIETEQALKDSGLSYTILPNTLYMDVLPIMLGGDVVEQGVRMIDGLGSAPLVACPDLGEANAVVLSEPDHENQTYTLGASKAFSFSDVAKELSVISGRPVSFREHSNEQFAARLLNTGFPKAAAEFLAEWSQAVSSGEFAEVTGS